MTNYLLAKILVFGEILILLGMSVFMFFKQRQWNKQSK